jgi:hypothetical protein
LNKLNKNVRKVRIYGADIGTVKRHTYQHVDVINEILEMFKAKDRHKGSTLKRFKELVECMGPEVDYNMVFGWDVAEEGRDTWS